MLSFLVNFASNRMTLINGIFRFRFARKNVERRGKEHDDLGKNVPICGMDPKSGTPTCDFPYFWTSMVCREESSYRFFQLLP